jgi:hypothetical protein
LLRNEQIIKYSDAIPHLRNADILLFRTPKFPRLGWFIGKYTAGIHSHAALLDITEDKLKAIEFKEFKGSRIYPIEKYLGEGKTIDVFRVPNTIEIPTFYKGFDGFRIKYFTTNTALAIIEDAKSVIGQSYDYKIIWHIFKTYLPFLRFVINKDYPENGPPGYVCSTLVAYYFRKHYLDLIPMLGDAFCTPADLARSGLTNYIMTLKG